MSPIRVKFLLTATLPRVRHLTRIYACAPCWFKVATWVGEPGGRREERGRVAGRWHWARAAQCGGARCAPSRLGRREHARAPRFGCVRAPRGREGAPMVLREASPQQELRAQAGASPRAEVSPQSTSGRAASSPASPSSPSPSLAESLGMVLTQQSDGSGTRLSDGSDVLTQQPPLSDDEVAGVGIPRVPPDQSLSLPAHVRRSSALGDSPTAPSSQRSRKVSGRIARAPGLAHCGDEIPVLTSAPSLRAIGCVPLAPRMSRRGAGSNAGLLRFAPCSIYSATRSYAMTSCAR